MATPTQNELQFVFHHLKSAENGLRDLGSKGDDLVERYAVLEAETQSVAERVAQTMREMERDRA